MKIEAVENITVFVSLLFFHCHTGYEGNFTVIETVLAYSLKQDFAATLRETRTCCYLGDIETDLEATWNKIQHYLRLY